MVRNLLLEIGTEELPSSCIKEAIINLKKILEETLTANKIDFGAVKTFATPRRITAFVKDVAENQKSEEKIITGPPKKIAFDEHGNYTKAAIGFARSLNLKPEDLIEIDNGKGIYLGIKIMDKGKKTSEIFPDILKNAILSLSFSKQMTWGNYSARFARPIRWIAAIYGSQVVRFEIENIVSANKTYGHRFLSNVPIEIPELESAEEYMEFLEAKAYVVLDPAKRKERILNSIRVIEEETWDKKNRVVIDEDLLEEVVNLIEIPNVLVGNFPEEYLYIPKEILIKAIQHHQRYFAVLDEDGNVVTFFVTVQNGIEDKRSEIIKGNERVLRARLSDAKYFYEVDKKESFENWLEKLDGVIFYSGIGSLKDKTLRLGIISREIVRILAEKNFVFKSENLIDNLSRASRFCKCDLVTNLVVEFPELQGLVGREYALEKGENMEVAAAIFEHYLPRFAGDTLPDTDTGAIVSIADKIDTITGMFLTGNIPSGSEDPFALRRKASGIILTALKKGYDLDIQKISDFAVKLFIDSFTLDGLDTQKITQDIIDFIAARYRYHLERNNRRTDIFDAIRDTGCYSVVDMDLRYKALYEYLEKEGSISMLSEPLTRCKNIIKEKSFSGVKTETLKEEAEISLYNMLAKKEKLVGSMITGGKYHDAILELVEFAGFINTFFDKVLVMDRDEELRNNRINLIKRCTDLYYSFADFSKIS